MILRKCRECGIEARNEDELELFVLHRSQDYLYDRMPLCKKCHNRQVQTRNAVDERFTLRKRIEQIKSRCYNPKNRAYQNYGGRGISVCREWLDNSDSFVDWSLANGFKRELQIDRINNDGAYSPENCRWVTPTDNLMNKRTNTTDYVKLTRICRTCKVEKPLTDFHVDKSKSMGRRYECRVCYNLKRRGEQLMNDDPRNSKGKGKTGQ